jgi:hypothetical protein
MVRPRADLVQVHATGEVPVVRQIVRHAVEGRETVIFVSQNCNRLVLIDP